jgi:hypothetical protein
MTREQIIAALREQQPAIVAEGVTALYLFGSYARDEADEFSDVDLAIEYRRPFSLLDQTGVRQLIEDRLHLPVDIVDRQGLGQMHGNPEQDVIRVF